MALEYFTRMVGSNDEYCSSIWSAYYATHINKILKFVVYKIGVKIGCGGESSNSIRSQINLLMVEERRQSDLKLLYNLLYGSCSSEHFYR